MANTFVRGKARNYEVEFCPFCGRRDISLAITEEQYEEDQTGDEESVYTEDDIHDEEYVICGGCEEVFHVV